MFDNIFKIPEQKKVSPFWGGIKELLARAMFYVGIINFILIMVTAYHTSIKDIMPVPFLTFFLILTAIVFVVMIFEYVVILPSSIAFSNGQSYKHDNPIKDDMNKILGKLDDMEKEMKILEENIEELKKRSDEREETKK